MTARDLPSQGIPFGVVLLAEDHPVNQRVATVMLETLGFHVDVVADGAAAVRAAIAAPYHAVLMDCQIPVLNGYEATAEIRRRQGTSRHTPIIAVTASALPSDRDRCRAAGMDDYLAKPLSLSSLATVMAQVRPNGSDRPALDVRVIERLERIGRTVGEDLIAQLAVVFLTDADARVVALMRQWPRTTPPPSSGRLTP